MSDQDKKWYDSDDPERLARGAGWFGAKWIIVIIVFFALIGAAAWGVDVLTAGPAGKAGAYKQKESTQNRLFAQANFEDRYNTIKADIANITSARAAVKGDPKNGIPADPSQFNLTNLNGVIQICHQDVAGYDADSGKYLLRDFKSAGLPQSVKLSVCK